MMAQSIDFSRARIDGRVPVALFVIGSWFMKLNILSNPFLPIRTLRRHQRWLGEQLGEA